MRRVNDFLTHPHRRFLFELAEKLGRTVEELLYGSYAYRPISSAELSEWEALWHLKGQESEEQARQNR
jgi:hypothetical protein